MSEKSQRILMIEDDIFLRKIYRDKLLRAGFDFLEATNGEEGLNKIVSERPDLVLLDIVMPRKNGFDVLSDMKMKKEVRDIPVIILSNLAQESDIQKGLNLGARGYIVKADTTLTEVVEKVKSCLVEVSRKK